MEWQIRTVGNRYEKIPATPEDNWVWSPQGVVDMHRPEMWGLVQFTRRSAGEEVPVTPLPGKAARDLALEIYYAQRDFFKAHDRWAANLIDLGCAEQTPAGIERPVLELTPDGYRCAAGFTSGGRHGVWRIRQDRLLKLDWQSGSASSP